MKNVRLICHRLTGSPLALSRGGHTGGVGTQVRSGNGVWKVPGCPQGFLGPRGGRVLARGTR